MKAYALSIACALGSVGCGHLGQGTLRSVEIARTLTSVPPRVAISVAPVADLRPDIERDGASIGTRLFIFFGVGVFFDRRGNAITSDYDTSPDAGGELRGLAASSIASSGVARGAVEGPSEFELRLSVEHLYATHFAVEKALIIVLSTQGHTDTDVSAKGHDYGNYGVVTLKAELVDRRGAKPTVVWTEHVSGYAQRPAAKEQREQELRNALRMATTDALSTLTQRVGAALDRLGVGPSGPSQQERILASAGAPSLVMPTTFAIERISRYRDFLERVFIDTNTGRVLRHEITPAPDRYAARPGDWLLARVTAEGVALSAEGYDAFAHALADRYDLRVVDDAAHFHFFGVRGAVGR